MKFFDRMLTVFFARQNPDSTSANPRFMKNTKAAVSTTQIVSKATVSSSAVFASALGTTPRQIRAAMQASQYFRRLSRCIHSPRKFTLSFVVGIERRMLEQRGSQPARERCHG